MVIKKRGVLGEKKVFVSFASKIKLGNREEKHFVTFSTFLILGKREKEKSFLAKKTPKDIRKVVERMLQGVEALESP